MTLSGKTAPFSKDLHKKVGIYRIVCRANGRAYVGGSVNLGRRKIQHCFLLREGRHYAKELQKDWDLFGCESFDYEILEFCETLQDLARLEEYWISKAESTNPLCGYNHSERSLNPLIACNNPNKKIARRMSAEERLRLKEVKDPVYFLEKYGEEEMLSLSIRTLKRAANLLRIPKYSLMPKENLVTCILAAKGSHDIAELLLEGVPVAPKNKRGRKKKPVTPVFAQPKTEPVYWLCSSSCEITKVEGVEGIQSLTGMKKALCNQFALGKQSSLNRFRLLGQEDPATGIFKKSEIVEEYRLASRKGELVRGTSCQYLAEKCGLALGAISQLKNGYLLSCKGWSFIGVFDVLSGNAVPKKR